MTRNIAEPRIASIRLIAFEAVITLSRSKTLYTLNCICKAWMCNLSGPWSPYSASSEIVFELVWFCKQRSWPSAINSWSRSVQGIAIDCPSVGLTGSCGCGSHSCGTTGGPHCPSSTGYRHRLASPKVSTLLEVAESGEAERLGNREELERSWAPSGALRLPAYFRKSSGVSASVGGCTAKPRQLSRAQDGE